MRLWTWLREAVGPSYPGTTIANADGSIPEQLRADGGERRDEGEEKSDEPEDADGDSDSNSDSNSDSDIERSNVEVTEPGETEPADPRWEEFDPEDIPEFEIRADEPTSAGGRTAGKTADESIDDPTAGMPNRARSPGQSRIKEEGTEGFVAAVELCARLPEDVRLPKEAEDLVPVAVEAELEEDIRAFATAEFDTASPHVETLSFVEVDDEIWLRIRLGIPPEVFADLDPEEIRNHALQQLEGLF